MAFEVSTGTPLPSAPTTGDKLAVVRQVSGTWTPYSLDWSSINFAPLTGIPVTSLAQGAGTNGQALVLSGGVPTWTTLSAGTVYTGTLPIVVSGSTIGVNTFGSAAAGVVPLSGGGTTNYLRADGTWATPPGGITPQVTVYTASGAIDPNDTLSVLHSATALSMTLINPTANSQMSRIVRYGPSDGAHTVTATINGVASTTRTLSSPNGGDALHLAASTSQTSWFETAQLDPGLKTTDLTAGSALTGTEVFAGTAGTTDFKYAATQLAAYVRGTNQRSATLSFGMGALVASGTIYVDIVAGATLNTLKYNVGSAGGSFAVTVTNGGSNVPGLSSLSVTSSSDTVATATSNNVVANTGARIGLVFSSVVGSPTDATLTLVWTPT